MISSRLSCILLTLMPSRALLLSQAGPHAARAFTVFPTSAELTVTSPLFRVLLLRRLRLLPVAPRTCACRGRLGPLGDHRAACATSGPGPSLLNALLRGSAKAVRVSPVMSAYVRLADMNIDVPVSDEPWMPPSSAPSPGLVRLSRERTCTLAEQQSTEPRDASAIRLTLSSCAPVAAAWLLSVSKSAVVLALKQPPGSACSTGTGP